MLRRISFGNKLKFYFALPFILTLLVASYLIHEEIEEYRAAGHIHSGIQFSLGLAEVAHKLQIERGLSAGFISSADNQLRAKVASAREEVDDAIASLAILKSKYLQHQHDHDATDFQQHYHQVATSLQRLAKLRQAVNSRDARHAFNAYSNIIAQQLHVISNVQMAIPFIELHSLDHEFINLLWLQERMGQERGAMNGLLSSGIYDDQIGMSIWDRTQQQTALLTQLQHTARATTQQRLAHLQQSPLEASMAEVRALLKHTMGQQQRFNELSSKIDIPSLLIRYRHRHSDPQSVDLPSLRRDLQHTRGLVRNTQTELAEHLTPIHQQALVQIDTSFQQMLTTLDQPFTTVDDDPVLNQHSLIAIANAINQLQQHHIDYDHQQWWKIATARLNNYQNLSNAVALELDNAAIERRGLVGWRIAVVAILAIITILLAGLLAHLFELKVRARIDGVSTTLSKLAASADKPDHNATTTQSNGDQLSAIDRSLNQLIIANESQRHASAISNTVFEHLSEGMVICDGNNCIQSVNPAFSAITGYSPKEAIGNNPSMLRSGQHDADFYQQMWASLHRDNSWHGEITNRHKNGDSFSGHLSISVLRDSNGNPLQYIGLMTDISELKQYEQQMWRQANYDAITGLPNRNHLIERLKQEQQKALANGTQFGVYFIDLDRFKYINDTFGHSAGDQLLTVVAQRLASAVQKTDLIARIGGDEFVVVISNLADTHCVGAIAKRLLSVLSPPISLGEGYQTVISCSIGITLYPDDGISGEVLLKNADTAMYKAKELGRNRYTFFTPDMQTLVVQQTYREQDLRQALRSSSFELHYQPVFDLQQGYINGAEALVRMNHPDKGLVYPDEFIELAEELMLINPIFDWVLNEALSALARWHRNGLALHIAVNVSPKQTKLADKVLQALALHGISPRYLKLEITEGLSIDGNTTLIDDLRQLRQRGIAIHLDDFGTGYSSLNYLTRLPISLLKIDRSFLPSEGSEEKFGLVNAVVRIAKSLELDVLAEGIENQSQYQRLQRMGCDFGQGYLISKPLTEAAFCQLIEHNGGRINQPEQRLGNVC